MKARFTEKQDPVTWNALPDGNVDVMICLNEKTVTETYPDTDSETEQTVFEYDFNQFREKQEKILPTFLLLNGMNLLLFHSLH